MYGKTYTQSYTPVLVKDPENNKTETVYIPATLEASLKAVGSCYFSDPSENKETERAFLESVAKVQKTLERLQKNEYFFVTNNKSIEDPSEENTPKTVWKESIIWNTPKGWRVERVDSYARGGFSFVSLTENVAMRELQSDSTNIGAKIIEDINPKGNLVGIQKPKLGSAHKFYDITSATLKDFNSSITINQRHLGDLEDSDFSREELPKMCARLAEGVKTLHSKEVYHLDIKPANILYDGNGVVYLSDFDGAISHLSKENPSFTASMVEYQDYQTLLNANSMTPKERSFLFSKMDIFALGVTFYQGCAYINESNPWPYDFITPPNGDSKFANQLLDEKILRKNLESVYNNDQVEVILKMLSKRENRPSIEEVVAVFPSTLFSSDEVVEKNYLATMKTVTIPPPPIIRKTRKLAENILHINPINFLSNLRSSIFPRLSFA
jgi:serine/threonine protein kinase